MFRVCPNMAMLSRANATYVFENLGKKWFFLTHDYSWGHSGTRWARDVMKKRGATEVGEVKVPLGTRDFSAQLLQIRNSDAEVLVVTCGGFDKIALLKQMAEYRIHDKLKLADNSNDYADYWTVKAEERRGWGASELSYDETPVMVETSKRFHEMFPKAITPVIDCNVYNGYVAIMALSEAIDKAGTSDDVNKIIQAMEGLEVKKNLRAKPTYIDPRTHQFIGTIVVIEVDPKASPATNFYKTLKTLSAAEYEMTKEENPIDLQKEPL
jgi:branched-chain amino acid transport system substrate-binding protein